MTSSRSLLAGLCVVVLWAGAFPAIRAAVPEFGVVGLSIARLSIASLVLLALAPLFHVRAPRWRDVPLILGCASSGWRPISCC